MTQVKIFIDKYFLGTQVYKEIFIYKANYNLVKEVTTCGEHLPRVIHVVQKLF